MSNNFSPEQTCFIVVGVLLFFICIPVSLICCCKHRKRQNEYTIIYP